MPRDNFILKTLLEKGEVTCKLQGNSMTGKINSGDQVVIKQVPTYALRVGDIVYAKVKGNYYLHLLSAISPEDRYQISNNHGYVNGWINDDKIYGLCVKVKETIIVSDEDLERRSRD